MKALAWAIALVFFAGVVVAGCFAFANDEDSMGRLELVSHRYDPCEEDGYCGGDENGGGDTGGHRGGDYGGGKGGDTDQRGDHNCRNLCFYGLPAPGEEQPRSLFPPTPDAVRAFVLATMQAGIEMGRLFADTTITFVANILVGVA